MKILAIDTSSNICSVCLLEDNELISTLEIKDEKTHSEKLMPLVQKLLTTANTPLNEINLIACDKGPGSFTGIRIGISAVKAMAEVHKLDVIGVSSLQSLAYNEIFDGITCSLIDARNNQVYCGIFDDNHNKLGEYMADDILVILNQINSLIFNEYVEHSKNINPVSRVARVEIGVVRGTRKYLSQRERSMSFTHYKKPPSYPIYR